MSKALDDGGFSNEWASTKGISLLCSWQVSMHCTFFEAVAV